VNRLFFTTCPEILTDNGYVTGVSGKGWGPGRTAIKGRAVAGKRFGNFQQFLKSRPDNAPFCYWLGTSDPHRRLYDLSFVKRPAIELYDLKSDPDQLNNVADKPQYADTIARLSRQLDAKLKESGDPRADGKGDVFDTFPYLGGGPKFPGFGRK